MVVSPFFPLRRMVRGGAGAVEARFSFVLPVSRELPGRAGY
jgi:hypothetical protein